MYMFLQTDSSITMVNAVAAALNRQINETMRYSTMKHFLAKLLAIFGTGVRVSIANMVTKSLGSSRDEIRKVNSEIAANWAVSRYKFNSMHKFDVILVGAPSGGAAHLSAVLNAPFLTQHFLTNFRHPEIHPDDMESILKYGLEIARGIQSNDDSLEIIIHYDPVHDRFLIKHIDTVRIKLTKLPQKYQKFIVKHLKPEGTILFLDVKYMWKQQEIDKNIHYQVGGLGELSDDEFLFGSERLDNWLKNQGTSHRGGWGLADYDIVTLPESEWGTFNGLEQETKEFAEENGYAFEKITVDHPEKISALVAHAFYEAIIRENKKPNGIYFDCFTAINPTVNLETSLIPVWLPFNCRDSFNSAKIFLYNNQELFKETPLFYLTLVPAFTETPDLVSLDEWLSLLQKYGDVQLIGINPKIFPTDIEYPFAYPRKVRELMKVRRNPLESFLDVNTFLELVKEKL